MNTPPNEIRYFVHKRLIKAATGFVTSGFNPLSAVGGFLAPVKKPARRTVPRTQTARPGFSSSQGKSLGRTFKFRGIMPTGSRNLRSTTGQRSLAPPQVFGRCIPPWFDDGSGGCTLDLVPGPGGGGTGSNRDIGQTVMGRYGAGEMPGNLVVNRAVCRPGMVVGDDGICYNKSQLKNSEREWPRGRRPLLTGGDMRAISTAARAGKRLEGATKRLQKIGLMKKANRPRPVRLPPHQHQISSGG